MFGVLLDYEIEIVSEIEPFTNRVIGSSVILTLPDIDGLVVHAGKMSAAFEMLDEMLDVFLELEIGLELTELGFDYDKVNQCFYYEEN
jgi:hypothetical protein